MESPIHTLANLFSQLGLDDGPEAIQAFIASHQLPGPTALADAAYWNPAQARFLRETVCADADWAEPVDELSRLLSRRGAVPG
jgi:hypothetical protein